MDTIRAIKTDAVIYLSGPMTGLPEFNYPTGKGAINELRSPVMIAIKHRYTGTTLCEFDVDTIKRAAERGKADLYGADLRGADLRDADLRDANLYGADLYGADLRGADLYGADLRGADLRDADLRGADLYGADLYGADLYGADLRGAGLYGADLRDANLYGANLRGSDLYGADLEGANLEGANLEGEILTRSPLHIEGLHYWCLITEGYLRLGCKRFTHAEWADFDDAAIRDMDSHALELWAQWKAPILAMCAAHAANTEQGS